MAKLGVRRWLFLPFLGGESRHKEKYRRSSRQQLNGDLSDGTLTKHEKVKDFASKTEEDVVQDYNAPIHWWVLSTLFPLVAGTFGPMASAFNICAVAISWRVIVSPESTESEGHKLADPSWLVAVNAVSLGVAIIANGFLLGHMTGRIRFNLAGPLVIIGWYIAGFVDVALVAAAPKFVPLPNVAMAAYSQAYYYCAFAGVLYVILAFMLSMTAWGIWIGSYSTEFKVSTSQRSLMVQTIMFLTYVLCSAAVYDYIEGWTYLDAFYFVIVTLFTIGFGDLTPKTHLGRSLFFPFAVGGILFVGLIIANIRTLVLESGSKKISIRMVEKTRFKALARGDLQNGVVKLRGMKKHVITGDSELERREQEFKMMRQIQKQAGQNNRLFSLAFSGLAFMILWFVGAVAFWQAEKSVGGENWTYFESLYFTYVAQLTIGYGDFEPQTNSSKPTFVFWALLALPALTVLIGSVGDVVTDFVNWAMLFYAEHTPKVLKIFGIGKEKAEQVRTDAAVEAGESPKDAGGVDDDDDSFESLADVTSGLALPRGFAREKLDENQLRAAEDAYRPFLMLQVARKITDHLDADPPRKYTYAEWTWLLRLLGEDESTLEGHRIIGKPIRDGEEIGTPLRAKTNQVWSWLGQESPLMSMEVDSEPKWVLKRIMEVLEQDLKGRGHRRMSRQFGVDVAATLPS